MGSADVVPGVSGGTVALVTGIYPALVGAISTGSRALEYALRGSIRRSFETFRDVEWWFLIPLVVGAGLAVITLAGVLETLIVEEPIRIAAVFLGMILTTVVIAWRLLKQPASTHAVIAAVVGVVTFLLFGLQTGAAVAPPLWIFFGAGGLAICAFILPGVSGSFVLLSLGMYQAVLAAVNDRDFAIIVVFGLGAIISLAVFTRFLESFLERHHDLITSGLVGLMIGSVRILWPWPNGLGDENGVGATVLGAPRGDVIVPVVLAIVSAAAVLGVSIIAERGQRTGPSSNA